MKRILFFALLIGALAQAQLTSINENFESFALASLPQNGWLCDKPDPHGGIYRNRQSGNKYLVAYSNVSAEPVYLIMPELVSVYGKLVFYAGSRTTFGGSLEMGLVDDPSNIAGFEKISEHVLDRRYMSKIEVNVPQSTKKFIVFKFIPGGLHQVMGVDNVTFTPTQLSVNESEKSVALSEVIFDSNTRKLIALNHQLKSIQIINAAGQKVAEIKSPKKEEDVHLGTGVYIVMYENAQGEKRTTKIRVN